MEVLLKVKVSNKYERTRKRWSMQGNDLRSWTNAWLLRHTLKRCVCKACRIFLSYADIRNWKYIDRATFLCCDELCTIYLHGMFISSFSRGNGLLFKAINVLSYLAFFLKMLSLNVLRKYAYTFFIRTKFFKMRLDCS